MDRRKHAILALALAILVAPFGARPAQAQSVEESADHLVQVGGVLCREVAGGTSCTEVDGQTVDEEAVDAHAGSWLVRALAHQRGLDDDQPLRNALWTHTHNSYNADAYPQTLYGLDPNQLYTITDQLRMGIRAIEIDAHWVNGSVVVCHGGVDPLAHFGCGVNDPLLSERLAEVRDWIQANPTEVVLLYLENNLDDDPAAHDMAAEMIDQNLGDLVYAPPLPCSPLPMDTTRREIRDTGARVLIAGNCGPGGWGNHVHERGPQWKESSLGEGDDYPAYPCTAERNRENYDLNFIRRWADETGLSNAAGSGGDVTLADARNMIRCGVDMPGLDNLVPGDERLAQFVWSWAPDNPGEGGCAYQGEDGRFRSGECSQPRPFACTDAAGAWYVTPVSGRWDQGQFACGLVTYDVPRTGWENELLREVKGSGEVWVNYARVGAAWEPQPIGGSEPTTPEP